MSEEKRGADASAPEYNDFLRPNGIAFASNPTRENAYLTFAIQRYEPFARVYEKTISEQEVRDRVDVARSQILDAWKIAESPIERLLLPFLVFQDYGPHFRCPAILLLGGEAPSTDEGIIWVIPQLKVPRYRFDFAVCGRWRGRAKLVAVECDGAEFHDATRDAERDHFNSGILGVETIRASGREIYSSPTSVAERIGRRFADWAGVL